MIYKTLHRNVKLEENEPHYKPGMNLFAPEWSSILVPVVTPVVVK